MSSGPSDPLPHERANLTHAAALRELRQHVFESLGPAAAGVLYGIGYGEGRADGFRVTLGFEGGAPARARLMGPGLPLLFYPDSADLTGPFSGVLAASIEAELHREDFPPSDDPTCFVSAGYAAGWFSELARRELFVLETHCSTRGDADCRFEARPLSDWQRAADPRVAELLAALDLEQLAKRAREISLAAGEAEGPMLGQFDPLSPAAHIWGPVMILPYSGAEDSEDALASVETDIGPDQVRVVVVDLTGARIDSLEAAGLARLLDRVEAMGLEAILVGFDRGDTPPFREPGRRLAMPLIAQDLSEGVALGFQMCQSSRSTH